MGKKTMETLEKEKVFYFSQIPSVFDNKFYNSNTTKN